MRRKEKQVTDEKIILSVLEKAEVCRLGMCRGNVPYIVPMNFGIEDNNLYFHCAREGKKLDIIRENNKVCFEMETDVQLLESEIPCRWGAKYTSIIGFGKAEILETEEEKTNGLNIIMKKYSKAGEFTYAPGEFSKLEVIRVTIEEMTCKKSG